MADVVAAYRWHPSSVAAARVAALYGDTCMRIVAVGGVSCVCGGSKVKGNQSGGVGVVVKVSWWKRVWEGGGGGGRWSFGEGGGYGAGMVRRGIDGTRGCFRFLGVAVSCIIT